MGEKICRFSPGAGKLAGIFLKIRCRLVRSTTVVFTQVPQGNAEHTCGDQGANITDGGLHMACGTIRKCVSLRTG